MGPILSATLAVHRKICWEIGSIDFFSVLDLTTSSSTSPISLNQKGLIIFINKVLQHHLFSYFIAHYLEIGKSAFGTL